MRFSDPIVATIAEFLDRIGIPLSVESVADDVLLPGVTVRYGTLVFDPERLPWPGDLLHEAGHIAVTACAIRSTLAEIPNDPGEEMAAIAWSYAAALEAGIDPAIVFHEAGYKGSSASLLATFTSGGNVGVPLLAWYGMTADPKGRAETSLPAYPTMTHWLRQN